MILLYYIFLDAKHFDMEREASTSKQKIKDSDSVLIDDMKEESEIYKRTQVPCIIFMDSLKAHRTQNISMKLRKYE